MVPFRLPPKNKTNKKRRKTNKPTTPANSFNARRVNRLMRPKWDNSNNNNSTNYFCRAWRKKALFFFSICTQSCHLLLLLLRPHAPNSVSPTRQRESKAPYHPTHLLEVRKRRLLPLQEGAHPSKRRPLQLLAPVQRVACGQEQGFTKNARRCL